MPNELLFIPLPDDFPFLFGAATSERAFAFSTSGVHRREATGKPWSLNFRECLLV